MWRQENPSECNESDESALPLRRGSRAFKTLCRFVDSDAKFSNVRIIICRHIFNVYRTTMCLDHHIILLISLGTIILYMKYV